MTKEKNQKKIKLTERQKSGIRVCYAALRFFEALHKITEEEALEKFVKDVEKIINNKEI